MPIASNSGQISFWLGGEIDSYHRGIRPPITWVIGIHEHGQSDRSFSRLASNRRFKSCRGFNCSNNCKFCCAGADEWREIQPHRETSLRLHTPCQKNRKTNDKKLLFQTLFNELFPSSCWIRISPLHSLPNPRSKTLAASSLHHRPAVRSQLAYTHNYTQTHRHTPTHAHAHRHVYILGQPTTETNKQSKRRWGNVIQIFTLHCSSLWMTAKEQKIESLHNGIIHSTNITSGLLHSA